MWEILKVINTTISLLLWSCDLWINADIWKIVRPVYTEKWERFGSLREVRRVLRMESQPRGLARRCEWILTVMWQLFFRALPTYCAFYCLLIIILFPTYFDACITGCNINCHCPKFIIFYLQIVYFATIHSTEYTKSASLRLLLKQSLSVVRSKVWCFELELFKTILANTPKWWFIYVTIFSYFIFQKYLIITTLFLNNPLCQGRL